MFRGLTFFGTLCSYLEIDMIVSACSSSFCKRRSVYDVICSGTAAALTRMVGLSTEARSGSTSSLVFLV